MIFAGPTYYQPVVCNTCCLLTCGASDLLCPQLFTIRCNATLYIYLSLGYSFMSVSRWGLIKKNQLQNFYKKIKKL